MAVYTEIDDVALEAFVAQYDIGAVLSCKGIAEGVENSNFMLVTDRGPYILTLYEKRVHERDLPFFLCLMEHLAARGLPCPTPISGRDGKALRRAAGRPASIVSFLRGVWPRRPEPKHCTELGRAMARMHLAVADFPRSRANNLSLAGWQGLFEACRERADEVQPGLAKSLERELEHLAAHWPAAGGGVPQGVIHADLFPDNVFFLDDKLSGIIDFYFACNDAFAYDLAIALNAWCFEPDGAFNITKARNLFQAYGALRPLNAEELRLLPLFARGAALRFLMTRLYDWLNQIPGAMVRPKDPKEYVRKLNFHKRIKDASAYGLDGAK
jgi:homoserine kinase type II